MSGHEALLEAIVCRRQRLAASAADFARRAVERGAERVALLYQREAYDHAQFARKYHDLATWIPVESAA